MARPITRRQLLSGAAATGLAGPGALIGADAADATTGVLPTWRKKAGERPFPHRRAGVNMLPQIDHIVILMMENHSFDNYFGMLGRGDGFRIGADGLPTNSNPDPTGGRVRAYHAPSVCQAGVDISQDWTVAHASWDHGRNDGFVKAKGLSPMAYFDEKDLPFYSSLGRTFPLCDRWFCSTMAQTDPNRRFLMAGSAFGLVDDSFPEHATKSFRPGGFGTVFEMLNFFGIEWRNYYSSLPSSLLFPYLITDNSERLVKVSQFFTDAAQGTLPPVSLVDPDFDLSSEENPQDIQNGEQFAATIIDAVLKSPAWHRTLLVWTYDEWGGYYDHVPPRRAVRPDAIPPDVPTSSLDGDLYSWTGFRVPAVIVSPRARPNYVSHVAHDHTSILKLIETKWNLPALSDRDANASNLLDSLDLTGRPAFEKPPTLTPAVPVTPAQVAACQALSS